MSVTILKETTRDPITLMGERAGICYGSDISDPVKNYKRGLDCIESQHGRVMEFVNVELVIEGYSSRVIREWYTHIGGGPTRLQASTRYINYKNFEYFAPESIKAKPEALEAYNGAMQKIAQSYKDMLDSGVPREDAGNILPLGLFTKIVDKRNLRSYVDMAHQRLCTRAYHEYRKLMREIMDQLRSYSDEWKTVVDMLFVPKCVYLSRCPEKNGCGFFDASRLAKS